MFMFKKKLEMPSAAEALARPLDADPDRARAFRPPPAAQGSVSGGLETAMFGMGCFWGAERKFWELGDGIHITAVGYAAGPTPNPTYEEVCSRPDRPQRGRAGGLRSQEDLATSKLLKTFWENHDPTQGMRQGNDVGTQYRSGIYAFTPEQRKAAEASKAMYEKELKARRFDAITTEILDAPPFYFAEDYHQQYLAKNPMGYCGLGGTGVSCPIGMGVAAPAH